MNREEMYYNWMYHVPGIGKRTLEKMVEGGKTAEQIYGLESGGLSEYLAKRCGFKPETAEKTACFILNRKKVITPEVLKKIIERKGIEYSIYNSRMYPKKLKQIPDAPFGLYVKGAGKVLKEFAGGKPAVAIIGARECSEYGRVVAELIGRKCAEYGLGIVSGMARGVDATAQRAGLEAGGSVAAVLGCGVDVVYPDSAAGLYGELCRNGCIYSEYIPGTEPKANYFPPRNRIISGMADALVVVEAREKSGTMITVDMALEQGRAVYIVPGRLTDPMSAGCNRLIKQGAEIVCDPDELFEEIREKDIFFASQNRTKSCGGDVSGTKNPYPEESVRYAVYRFLELGPASIQQIYKRVSAEKEVDISRLSGEILHMQMEGVLASDNGLFALVAKNTI